MGKDKETVKVGMISLGCAKNRVDAEIMLGLLKNGGCELTPEAEDADVIVINTCGFIDSAKEEAIQAILDTARLKEEGKLKGIVVSGCLAQRYGLDIMKTMPEVDAIVGAYGFDGICDAVKAVLCGGKTVAAEDEKTEKKAKNYEWIRYYDDRVRPDLAYLDGERVLTTPKGFAYLKLAEGCSNKCTYCAIPGIRGPFRSRPLENLVREAETLVAGGARELVLVAQDTTMYGTDLNDGVSLLPELLERLNRLEDLKFIRILYLYPDEVTDRIVEAIRNCPKAVHYFDIPLQHINDGVLKRMHRRGSGKMYRDVIRRFREAMPDCVIRTSLITGFPGETEEEHRELLEFVREYRLDRVGVFPYSKEEGTPAARMKDQIPAATKKRRYRELMEAQQAISLEKNQARVGKIYDVITDRVSEDGMFYVGRSYMEAPEEDGDIYFAAKDELAAGDVVRVRIMVAEEYDLTGEQVVD